MVDPMKWSLKDLRIEGTWCYPVTIWPRIIGMISKRQFPIEKLIHELIDADDGSQRASTFSAIHPATR
ncbi:hypothetical protein AWB75_06934 [Caballeronia catudaia]|uniref:Uncharacterized protein n=2 Tax=Caballeronia catudaia TaxID=1777136 RepID=A0A158DLY8_9BURK|nr:hypothetical protein AWB75_06934 [Caballeronia catudaia]